MIKGILELKEYTLAAVKNLGQPFQVYFHSPSIYKIQLATVQKAFYYSKAMPIILKRNYAKMLLWPIIPKIMLA